MNKKCFLTIISLMWATNVFAAGYQLQEYSVSGLGRAFSGSGVMGDDYSALAFNPAGMNFVNQSGFQMGAIMTAVRAKVQGRSTPALNGTVFPEKSGKTHTKIYRVMPNFFGQYRVNEKTTFGLGLYVPFGLASDYKNNWFGAEHGQYSGITVVNLTPSVSYKILNNLSLGLGINLQYTEAHLTGAVAGGGSTDMRHAKDTGVGYTLGLTYKPFESTRLGISYRSKVSHKLHGHNYGSASTLTPALSHMTAFLDGKNRVNAKITTPETVIFSAAQDLNEKWTVSGIARWTRWNRFDKLTIYQENYPIADQPMNSTKEHWKNTWFLGMGVDYKYCKNLTFRLGTAWDNTTIRSPKYRTARIPDERRIWASFGASYTKNNWQLDVGYAHLFIHSAKATGTDGTPNSSFNAKYNLKSDIFGIQMQYKF